MSYLHPHELAVSSWRWPRLRGSSRTPANARKLLKGVGSVWLRSVAHTLVLGPLTPRVSASSTVSQLSQPPAINELHQRQESCLTPLCIRKPLLDRTPGVNAGLCRWQVAGFGREAAVFTVPTLSLCLGTSGHLGSRRLEPTCAQATVLCVTPHTPKAHAGRVSRARLIEPPPRAQVWGTGFHSVMCLVSVRTGVIIPTLVTLLNCTTWLVAAWRSRLATLFNSSLQHPLELNPWHHRC